MVNRRTGTFSMEVKKTVDKGVTFIVCKSVRSCKMNDDRITIKHICQLLKKHLTCYISYSFPSEACVDDAQ